MAVMEDFSVEMQNLLGKDLFPGKQVTHRIPKDPKYRVIKLDDHAEILEELKATKWGKELERLDQYDRAP
ncbi:hypothetical protein OLX02_16270 [Novosphingobium sp. KCTC 2891]|uniref:hypothetical protein n=1 Tax=Novosphingobium sp. KCTC 2891 TaxID=2989730 RepID=UPI002223C3C4|nr:hypothetical protein [Novosphingobium sp. KCTC 2891]MCW1384378.1 hypothetical protein [Novosphingobium sp. KCTC 2891]